jgi:hypothetical protein
VRKEFKKRFQDTKEPHSEIVRDINGKFRGTGSVRDAAGLGRSFTLTGERSDDSCDQLLRRPRKSISKLAQQTGLSYGSTRKAPKNDLQLFPYNASAPQATDYQKSGLQMLLLKTETTFWMSTAQPTSTRKTNACAVWKTISRAFPLKKFGVLVAISRSRKTWPLLFC